MMFVDGSTRRDGRAAVAVALVALALAGCASSAGSAGPTTTTAVVQGAATTVVAPAVETWTGTTDGFYRVPRPLVRGNPGDLIRVQRVSASAGEVTDRVMYHSRDTRGRDRAVTGLITYPTAAPPHGGWPVLSWEHGTVGLSTRCAPSRSGGTAPAFGVSGVVRVATDYIGLGPVGERHAYLSGVSEAHSGIDAVRAARRLTAAHAGSRWVAIGHSQGGHSALFTNQLAASYAPELTLLGTVVAAPAAVLTRTFGPADQIVPRMVGVMALYGLATDYPQLHPDDYVSAEVRKRAPVIDTGCSNDVVNAMASAPWGTFYAHDPATTEPARSILVANDPGKVKAASPLLLVEGTADTWVVPARVDALLAQLCRIGQVTGSLLLPGANHGTELIQGQGQIASWLTDRLAGRAAPNACAHR